MLAYFQVPIIIHRAQWDTPSLSVTQTEFLLYNNIIKDPLLVDVKSSHWSNQIYRALYSWSFDYTDAPKKSIKTVQSFTLNAYTGYIARFYYNIRKWFCQHTIGNAKEYIVWSQRYNQTVKFFRMHKICSAVQVAAFSFSWKTYGFNCH